MRCIYDYTIVTVVSANVHLYSSLLLYVNIARYSLLLVKMMEKRMRDGKCVGWGGMGVGGGGGAERGTMRSVGD